MTIATLFSGGGGVDVGAMAAGIEPIWGVEYDPAIAEVYRANVGEHILCQRVQDVEPLRLERPDILWASPPCPSFSVAKAGRQELAEDESNAAEVCRFLRALTPPAFVLENVQGYARSRSLARIRATLDELGYWSQESIINAADMGVPQTRKRLILRAVREGWPAPLPSPVPWVGWYQAIEDILDTLPESAFAEWQLKRLPEELRTICLIDDDASGDRPPTIRQADEPATTVKSAEGGRVFRAFIVDGQNGGRAMTGLSKGLTIRQANEPSFTITGSKTNQSPRAYENGRVVAMTTRALARFQSFPDGYILPEKKRLACTVIGNAVPPLMAQRILESLR